MHKIIIIWSLDKQISIYGKEDQNLILQKELE